MTQNCESGYYGLEQINRAVATMDRATQQNSAMVQETTAATASLASDAAELARLVSHFQTDGGTRTGPIAGSPGLSRQSGARSALRAVLAGG